MKFIRLLFISVLCSVAAMAVAEQTNLSARNLADNQKIIFFMGQDSETLHEYRTTVLDKDASMPKPGGITLYTKISNTAKQGTLAGLNRNTDYGSGKINMVRTLAEFPGAALAVGLDITDAHAGCKSIPTRAIAGIESEGVTKETIADYRAQVDKLINFLKDTQRPIFLRIGYEFDGPWNCYEPAIYKLAFRFIKQRINELRADKIATVWQSAAWPRNQGIYQVGDKNHLDKSYPGDDAVDWVAVSIFYGDNYRQHQWTCDGLNPEWFTPQYTPRSQQDRILNFARAHNKPVMIAEAAPVGFSNSSLISSCIFTYRPSPISAEEIWNSWYADWFAYIDKNKDVIRAAHYINTNWHTQDMWFCARGATAGGDKCNQGYWGDSRVQANAYILEKFKQEISRGVFVNGDNSR